MRDYHKELEDRASFIKNILKESGASGIVFGNSGGKDSCLVGILCKMACDNTLGIIMPCATKRNYNEDLCDAKEFSAKYGIETRIVDLTEVREREIAALQNATSLNQAALANIAPRLRMTTLYGIAGSENRLVAGTGNRSEAYVGYFTKWGDGAHDFNPISDLTVTEVYEFLRYLDAPSSIIEKAPSAALFDGQTDEGEMGVTYAELDGYILEKDISEDKKKRIDSLHKKSEHKRKPIAVYKMIK
ncbi:MAG: NAD(+) synthase [Clostridia bacterium]|nr:NAD(+) synthase [Clostridia bacterium]